MRLRRLADRHLEHVESPPELPEASADAATLYGVDCESLIDRQLGRFG